MTRSFIKNTAVFLAAVLMLSGCTKLSEELPDSYFATDTMTEAVTETYASETTAAETAFSSVTSSETTVPTTTGTETETLENTTAEPAVTTAVSSEQQTTAAPRTTTAQTTTAPPQTTVVTIPETTVTAAEEELISDEDDDTVPIETTVTATQTTEETTVTLQTDPSSGGYYPENDYYTLNFDRQKGVWISYLEFDRFMKNCDKDTFVNELNKCFDNMVILGCNTVYFQVRVYGDAYYRSSLFPKGDRLTGNYDPLALAVKSAHERGLSIHAWVNPMRLMTDSQMKDLSQEHPIGKWYNGPENGKYIVSCDGRYYLNPAYSDTVDLICDGIKEILSAYDVDGIQIDDYFYPTTSAAFDSAAYKASGTELGLGDWRRQNINRMVKKMYNAVHSVNPTAVFGISPQGNLKNNYNDLYADVYTWCATEGYCDYICPQIYFGFDNGTLPYADTVNTWYSLIKTRSVDLVIGLAAYKVGTVDKYAGNGKYEWANSNDILARQAEYTAAYGAGYAFFRYDSLFRPEKSVAEAVEAEVKNLYLN